MNDADPKRLNKHIMIFRRADYEFVDRYFQSAERLQSGRLRKAGAAHISVIPSTDIRLRYSAADLPPLKTEFEVE